MQEEEEEREEDDEEETKNLINFDTRKERAWKIHDWGRPEGNR